MRQRQESSYKDAGILWPKWLLWPVLPGKGISNGKELARSCTADAEGPVHFQLPRGTHHSSEGRELQSCTVGSCNTLWELVARAHQELGLWPSTCHLPLCSGQPGDTGHCWAHPISKSISQRYHFSRQECGYDFERQPLTTQRQALCAQVLAKVLKIIPFSCLPPAIPQAMGRTVLLVTSAHACTSGGHSSAHTVIFTLKLHQADGRLHGRPNAQHYPTNNKFKLNTLTLPHT